MARSSPEGIELSKGSNLESFSLSINKEKVLELKQQERSYSKEEVQIMLYECLGHFAQKHNIIIKGNEIEQWFEQFKK